MKLIRSGSERQERANVENQMHCVWHMMDGPVSAKSFKLQISLQFPECFVGAAPLLETCRTLSVTLLTLASCSTGQIQSCGVYCSRQKYFSLSCAFAVFQNYGVLLCAVLHVGFSSIDSLPGWRFPAHAASVEPSRVSV